MICLIGGCSGGRSDTDVPDAVATRTEALAWAKPSAQLLAPMPSDGAHFGASIGVSGRTIGASTSAGGAVHLFTRPGLRAPFVAQSVTSADAGFGASIAFDGGRLFVAAPGKGCIDSFDPAADGTWKAGAPQCGGDACGSGDVAVANGLAVLSGAACAGASYVGFGTGALAAVDASSLKGAPGAIAIARLGTSALVVIGEPTVVRGGGAGAGVVQVGSIDSSGRFDFLSAGNAPDATANASFGASVAALPGIVTSAAGTPFTLLVGAPGRASNAGGLYVFDTGSSSLAPPKWRGTFEAEGRFGASIAVSGDRAVVGAPDEKGVGAAYVLERDPTTGAFAMTLKMSPADGAAGDHFGAAVAIDGDLVAVAAPDRAIAGHAGAGAVYAFDLSPAEANGTSCTADAECTSGNCVDSTCCSARTCDPGKRCDVAGTAGICAYPAPEDVGSGVPHLSASIQRCLQRSDCASGFCVDGVCCNTPCTDRCTSCAVPGHEGTCTIEPAGFDLRNECGSSGTCIATCNGARTCGTSFPGAHCRNNHCTGPSTGEGTALCKAGSCDLAASAPFDCSPFACAAAFGACLTSCASSTDCAPGFVCDDNQRLCVSPTPADESGCSMGRGSKDTSSFALFACLGIAWAVFRRRASLATVALATACSNEKKHEPTGSVSSALAVETRIQAFDETATDRFGSSLSLFTDGGGTPTLAVGAPARGKGAVYLYGFDGTRWSPGDTLTESPATSTAFGASVGAFGSELVVASQASETMFTIGRPPQRFGPAVSSPELGRMGVSRHSPSATESGTLAISDLAPETTRPSGTTLHDLVYVFHNEVGVFVGPDAVLSASDGDTIDGFGASVAANEEWVVVGCDPRVHARPPAILPVYAFHGTGVTARTWTASETQKVTIAGVAAEDVFGAAIALDATDGTTPRRYTLVVGAPGRSESEKSVGAVYVFGATGASAFTFQQKILAPDGADGDGFGASLALSGDSLVIGAPSRAPAGAVYRYTRTGATWAYTSTIVPSDGAGGDAFGSAVAVAPEPPSGVFVAVGNAPATKKSTVYVYGSLPLAAGAPCGASAECTTGHCVDGTCCTTSSCEEGAHCNLSFSPGVCVKPSLFSDAGSDASSDAEETSFSDATPVVDAVPPDVSTTDTPQVSGPVTSCDGAHPCQTGLFCVDGVCCDTACNEPCHSCVLPFAPGRCSPEPTGIDLRAECAADGSCNSTCGPSGACVSSFAGAQCHKSRCTGLGKGEGPAVCASAGGACGTPIEFDCGPFACQPAIGACVTVCTSSDDCNLGFVCALERGLCIAASPPADDSGCALSTPRGPSPMSSVAGFLFSIFALGVARKRRR